MVAEHGLAKVISDARNNKARTSDMFSLQSAKSTQRTSGTGGLQSACRTDRIIVGCIIVKIGSTIPVGRLLISEFAQTFFLLLFFLFQISLAFFKRVIWFCQGYSLISVDAEYFVI